MGVAIPKERLVKYLHTRTPWLETSMPPIPYLPPTKPPPPNVHFHPHNHDALCLLLTQLLCASKAQPANQQPVLCVLAGLIPGGLQPIGAGRYAERRQDAVMGTYPRHPGSAGVCSHSQEQGRQEGEAEERMMLAADGMA